MATLNRLGMFMQRYTMTSTLRPLSTKWRPAATATRSLPRPTFLPQQRSMATIQTTTDVASASYHFKKQKHLPYFLEYLMWVVFGSECLHLIWLKSDYKEYKDRTQHKIALFKDLLALLESNSPVPESLREEIRMVLRDEKFDKQLYQDSDVEDDYLEKLIAASEEADRVKTTPPSSPTSSDTIQPSIDEHTKAAPSDKEVKKPKFII